MEEEKFIYCLEAVSDVDENIQTAVQTSLEELAMQFGIASIHKTCDTIEGFEESLGALVYDDHHFKDYEIIYLVMPGQHNSICLHDYFYSLEEIAELFEGKLKGKIIHFANLKILDLTSEEAQFFLDVTGAKAISGYGLALPAKVKSTALDKVFFSLYQEEEDVIEVVELMHQKWYTACKALDFRLYYTA
ncbi:DUF6642 family protein [Flavobacterium agrisoli]|uniref:Uncharacterized protein n=1 Tax=Flavobacterium agrisoli TaxID=2793066 RepID=A0A934PNV4_9FLAO|nr:DUF6642 family protein [Flavobacterium agrisoli]MBK0370219.1 hypothetical protein [Flavobacterium agrisoli]